MKEEYEDRLQRVKNKLEEERVRRKSRRDEEDTEERQDDASYCSGVSRISLKSYTSEYSRASSKRDNKGPRSEWRNKARAVIERGKNRKEEADFLLLEDVTHHSARSSNVKDREAEIDSLVERNALLNERERLLKVESDLLDAAEAEARATDRARAEAYLGKDIHDEAEEERSLDSSLQSVATTRTSASVRARRIREDEADELNRSFQHARAAWQDRCKDENSNPMDDPTPIKSNSHFPTKSRAKRENKPAITMIEAINYSDHLDNLQMELAGSSPVSAKSVKSTRSARSARSARSLRSTKTSKSEQIFSSRGKVMRNSNMTNDEVFAWAQSQSVNSDIIPQNKKSASAVVDLSILGLSQDQDHNYPEERKRERRSTRSYRRQSEDPLESYRKIGLADDEEESSTYRIIKSSSASVSSNRSKRSYRSDRVRDGSSQDMENESHRVQSSASVSSNRSRHSYHSKKWDAHEEDDDDMSTKRSSSKGSHRIRSSASASSNRSKHSSRSERHEQEQFENRLPEELSIPTIIDNLENGENESPTKRRELSYREKSAMLASMENNAPPNQSGTDEESSSGRNLFRQRGQRVKKSKSSAVLPVLAEQKNLYNTNTSPMPKGKQPQNLTNLVSENKELRARLEKERIRRAELDNTTSHLQLQMHQKEEEINQLKLRKDMSAAQKEKFYDLEDALRESKRRLAIVVEENNQLRHEREDERARRCKAEIQSKQHQAKIKKRADEVVALARKNETVQKMLLEERHVREVAESQLAQACLHINKTQQERDEDMDELEKENSELRHKVKRTEGFLRQLAEQHQKPQQSRPKKTTSTELELRRQSVGSMGGISAKPSIMSEITTDFEYDELNTSQTGEI